MAIVLLVEESQTIRRVVEMALKGSGHDIIAAGNVSECRQALYQYSPAVMLINYLLPEINGIDLCREIKSNPATAHLPVVVLGGSYAPFQESQALAAGADAVLVKPFLTDDLINTLNQVVSSRPAPRPAAMPAVEQPPRAAALGPSLSQPAPYAPTPVPRGPHAPEPARRPTPLAPMAHPPSVQPPSSTGYPQPMAGQPVSAQASGFTAPAAPASSPAMLPAPGGAYGRGPVSREVSSSQRAPFQPGVRYPTGQAPAPAPARLPSGHYPRGFQQPVSQPAAVSPSPVARIPSSMAPAAPGPPPRPAPGPPPEKEVQAQARPQVPVDPQELRSVLREVLPPIVRDALRQLFRDGLEVRLRNYAQERIDQFMQEEVRQLTIQILRDELNRQR